MKTYEEVLEVLSKANNVIDKDVILMEKQARTLYNLFQETEENKSERLNEFRINLFDEAMYEISLLYPIYRNYPELTIEAGFTKEYLSQIYPEELNSMVDANLVENELEFYDIANMFRIDDYYVHIENIDADIILYNLLMDYKIIGDLHLTDQLHQGKTPDNFFLKREDFFDRVYDKKEEYIDKKPSAIDIINKQKYQDLDEEVLQIATQSQAAFNLIALEKFEEYDYFDSISVQEYDEVVELAIFYGLYRNHPDLLEQVGFNTENLSYLYVDDFHHEVDMLTSYSVTSLFEFFHYCQRKNCGIEPQNIDVELILDYLLTEESIVYKMYTQNCHDQKNGKYTNYELLEQFKIKNLENQEDYYTKTKKVKVLSHEGHTLRN